MPNPDTERPVRSSTWLVALAALGSGAHAAAAQGGPPPLEAVASRGEADPEAPRGLVVNEPEATPGFTLVSPLNSTRVHLVDREGRVAHTWETGSAPGAWCYLLDDGSLLHAGREEEPTGFRGGGIGGRLRRFAPDGSVLWRHDLADRAHHQHHDLEPLPDGNVIVIAWERRSREEAVARGRRPEAVGEAGLWPDALYELRPTPPEGAEIVWEWHAWDHIVQDVDPEKPDYGALADRPERLDVNAGFVAEERISDAERAEREAIEDQMAALGYAGGDEAEDDRDDAGPPRKKRDDDGDWLHVNSIDVNLDLALVVFASPELGEVYVIDRSTTTEEAAGSTGGRWGRGGDLLWRWGNPAVHGAGTAADRRLFYQHDPTWVAGDGLRLLVFNNGRGRPDGDWSSVDELVLPFDPEHGFRCAPRAPCGPAELAWTYADRDGFYSAFISGAQRLASGNTLICSGTSGRLFEVTRAGRIVWEYRNELGQDLVSPDHAGQAPKQALFRGTRLAPDHPGVKALLAELR